MATVLRQALTTMYAVKSFSVKGKNRKNYDIQLNLNSKSEEYLVRCIIYILLSST